MSRRGCEAEIKHRTMEQGLTDGMYDLDGKRVSLPEGTKETLTKGETTISCSRQGCEEICPKVIQTEGLGFAPYNAGMEKAEEYLSHNCPKLKAMGYKNGNVPEDLLPN